MKKILAKVIVVILPIVAITSFLTLGNNIAVKNTMINSVGLAITLLSLIAFIVSLIILAIKKTKESASPKITTVASKTRHWLLWLVSILFFAVILIVVVNFWPGRRKENNQLIEDIAGNSTLEITFTDIANNSTVFGLGICVSPRLGTQNTLDSKCDVTNSDGKVIFNLKEGNYWVFPDLRTNELYILEPELKDKNKLRIKVENQSFNSAKFVVEAK